MDAPTVAVQPDRLVAGGEAMGRLDDGRVVFVSGVLPGETAHVVVTNDKKDFVRAELRSVDDVGEPSPNRVVPPCPHRRDGCGGCDWMHLDVEAQFVAKVEIVAESLRRIGRLDADLVDSIVTAGGGVEPYGYRTTVRLTGLPEAFGGGIGFREERSDRVVSIDHCQIAHPNLSVLLRELDVAPGVELTLRTSDATGAVTARWTKPEQRRRSGRRRRESRPQVEGEGARRAVSGVPSSVHVGDRAFLMERVGGVELRISAPSFFQSGPDAALLLTDAVERAAPELYRAKHAVDAYGGVGLFAAAAMRQAAHVTLLESSRSACFDATKNLDGRSATVVRGDVASWDASTVNAPVDVVVADPARSGLGRVGVDALAAAEAPVFVLVSCDPVSAARDVALLAEHGYRPKRIEVLDLFPQTHHVETVTRFTR